MKHTATQKERMVLSVLQDTMLHAECNQQECFTISILLVANLMLGILRDKVVPGGEAEMVESTMKTIRSAMEMYKRMGVQENKVQA
jgi:hypothetical protein